MPAQPSSVTGARTSARTRCLHTVKTVLQCMRHVGLWRAQLLHKDIA